MRKTGCQDNSRCGSLANRSPSAPFGDTAYCGISEKTRVTSLFYAGNITSGSIRSMRPSKGLRFTSPIFSDLGCAIGRSEKLHF